MFSFLQTLIRITDVSYLTRERTRSTFLDDFRQTIERSSSRKGPTFEWSDPVLDPRSMYPFDCRIEAPGDPLFLFALSNDGRVRDATITLLQFEKWGVGNRSVGIFEDQESINRKVLARFTDVCGKQFSALGSNRERIERYLTQTLEG